MIGRIAGILHPPVRLLDPKPGTIIFERHIEATTRDGTRLRVNICRPSDTGEFPVILCAHPYGKDNLPSRGRLTNHLSIPYRILRQKGPIVFSTLTTWEAPDPMRWVEHRYVVVNADLRGCGASDGKGSLLSDQEGEDVYDLIEWAAKQPWSNGSVGMNGVSYLALSQYKAASLHPPSLRAICVWEGLTDIYRDFVYPGGIREDGFVKMWSRALKGDRLAYDIREFATNHPFRDEIWRSLVPNLSSIEVPILVCGSFSDHCLHSQGSFRAFCEVSSSYRELYTHRAPKWGTYYSDEAFAAQLAFFDCFLKSTKEERTITRTSSKVRLEVRSDRDNIVEVRKESSWPLDRTIWTPLYLAPSAGLDTTMQANDGHVSFETRTEAARFSYNLPNDVEVTGPMAAHLWVEIEGSDDIDLFVGVELWRDGRYVEFEGSYGFGRDRVSTGWLKGSLRELDQDRTKPWAPEHKYLRPQPLNPGEIVLAEVALLPSATLFRKDDELRLIVAGRWLSPTGLLKGQFPAAYPGEPKGRCTLHWGPARPAHLLIPIIPAVKVN